MNVSWNTLCWSLGLWAAAWLAAKIVSVRKGWDYDLVEDTWVRLCCIAGGLVPFLHLWTLLLLLLLPRAYKAAEAMSEKARIRVVQRAAYDEWWSRTQYRWERKWERVPRRGY